MRLVKDDDVRLDGLKVCLVVAEGVSVSPPPDGLARELAKAAAFRAAHDLPDGSREAMREALRGGGFKPSGRNKPASEYLARTAREGNVPVINNLVDCNNLLSLETGLPVSLLDADALGDAVLVRVAREGESYVFNTAGQAMDLCGLACICSVASGRPLGNPVKDSMEGKVKEATNRVAGFVYAPAGNGDRILAAAGERFAEILRLYGGPEADASYRGIV